MNKKLITKNILLGVLSWVIPFVVSLLFVKPGGEFIVPYATFKSIIMVVGTMSGCYLFYRYFKYVENDFVKNGVIVGLSWFAINIILDTLVLIPMMNATFAEYFMSIGIGYFAIPTISLAMSFLLQRKARSNQANVANE